MISEAVCSFGGGFFWFFAFLLRCRSFCLVCFCCFFLFSHFFTFLASHIMSREKKKRNKKEIMSKEE